MLGPWLCPPETDPELQASGASGAVGWVPVAQAHARSVCQRDIEHTFSFPEIPSHCESPFRRDFPPGLTQAASRLVTQTGVLPASPTSCTARARRPEPGIGAGGSLPDPQRGPTAATAKGKHKLGVVLQSWDPKSSRLSSRLYLKF